jgi:hypothetical protein
MVELKGRLRGFRKLRATYCRSRRLAFPLSMAAWRFSSWFIPRASFRTCTCKRHAACEPARCEPAFSDGNSSCSAAASRKRYISSSAGRSDGAAIYALGLDGTLHPLFFRLCFYLWPRELGKSSF